MQLAVGSFPRSNASIFHLRQMGITAILSLTEVDEGDLPTAVFNSFVWQRVAIPDGFKGGIPTRQQFDEALTILARWRNKGHVIYVHCLAGVGRSPAVCAAHIVQIQGISLEEAISFVKKKHSLAAPDANQVQVMKEFFGS